MANKRISDLSSASTLTLNDLMVVVNEAQTRKMTIETFLNYLENLEQFATLDTNGKIPVEQIPSTLLGAMKYQASWDASVNTPPIPAAETANAGWYYVVGTSGSTNIDGITNWNTGDWIISNGVSWQKIDNTDVVTSWNARTGAIVPQSGDYTTDLVTEGTSNKYYTAARVLGEILTGLSANNSAITAADSILTALGKAQGQINAKENSANKSQANGYASLDATGKVPLSEIPSSILGAAIYQSSWNATTNTPTIPAASGSNKGWYYVVSVAGTTSVSGINDWKLGDWIISNGTAWEKVDNTDALLSWNNRTGAVVPQLGDYTTSIVAEGTNQYFTTARVLATALANFTPSSSAIVATDTIIAAFGKAQGQINAKESTSNKGQSGGYAGLDTGSRLSKTNSLRGVMTLKLDFTGYTAAANTTEQLLFAHQIPASTFAAGDQLNLEAWIGATSNANNKTFKVYLNTTNSLTGANLIGTFIATTNSASVKLERDISFITTTSIKAGIAAATSSLKGDNATTLDSTAITIPNITSSFYVIISGQKATSTDTLKIERVMLNGFYQ